LGADREKWGKVNVIQEWFRHYSRTIKAVPEVLRLNGDEIGVVIRERGKLVCLPGCRFLRLRGETLPHFTVFPVFNCFGDGPAPFIVIPEFRSAQARFARIHRRKVYIAQSRSGWVSYKECAVWVCLWLEKFREDHGLLGQPAALFLDNAPTRRNSEAMHVFRQHNVIVVLFPPHLTE
jgi:hypothetical protein